MENRGNSEFESAWVRASEGGESSDSGRGMRGREERRQKR